MEQQKDESLYAKMGVDASKKNVKAAFGKTNETEYPGAWVNIITAFFNSDWAVTQHMDGDGSKMIQRLLHYFETGNKSILRGAADDALAMNTSDIAASGFVFGQTIFTDVLNLNLPPDVKEVLMAELAHRFGELRELYRSHGIDIYFLGGEIADLPDQVLSAVLDVAVTSYAKKEHLITGNVQDGDLIYGFASDGQAAWEENPNGGGMANGMTLARTISMSQEYNKKYPQLKGRNRYMGAFNIKDDNGLLFSRQLLSPTRQWLIVIKILMENLIAANALHHLHGISVNTGGGATKIMNLGSGGIVYHKTLPEAPLLFQILHTLSAELWQNMYKTFNCGIGLDVVGSDDEAFRAALTKTSEDTKVRLYKLGSCRAFSEELSGEEKHINTVILSTPYGTFSYSQR
ncbi:MAG: hypothetical protein Q8Q67_02640 [bacterium]|nr:hypothetical protein [bacterium]